MRSTEHSDTFSACFSVAWQKSCLGSAGGGGRGALLFMCLALLSITPNAAYEGTAYGEAVLRMERVTEGAAEGAVGPGAH